MGYETNVSIEVSSDIGFHHGILTSYSELYFLKSYSPSLIMYMAAF